jgi:hypothetical protein
VFGECLDLKHLAQRCNSVRNNKHQMTNPCADIFLGGKHTWPQAVAQCTDTTSALLHASYSRHVIDGMSCSGHKKCIARSQGADGLTVLCLTPLLQDTYVPVQRWRCHSVAASLQA